MQSSWAGAFDDMTGCCQELFITRKRTSVRFRLKYAVQINIRIEASRHVMVTPGTVLKLIPCENTPTRGGNNIHGVHHRTSQRDFRGVRLQRGVNRGMLLRNSWKRA